MAAQQPKPSGTRKGRAHAHQVVQDFKEKAHFEDFRAAAKKYLAIEIPAVEKNPDDPPDFLIPDYFGKRLGVEHTELLVGANLDRAEQPARHEAMRKRLCNLLGRELDQRRVKIDLGPEFFNPSGVKDRDLPSIASRLAECAIALADPSEIVSVPSDLASPFYSMTIRANGTNCISYITSGRVNEYPDTIVQRVLRRKANSIDQGRKKCDELWLLLVADGWQPAAFIEPSDSFSKFEFETNANAVFLLHSVVGGRRVMKLNCRRP